MYTKEKTHELKKQLLELASLKKLKIQKQPSKDEKRIVKILITL